MLLVLVACVILLLVAVAYLFNLTSVDNLLSSLNRLKNGQKLFTALYRVEDQSSNHGGTHVANVLKEAGVEFIFTLVGGHISPILVACEQSGIRVIDTRHEVTAVFAADAVARCKQTIGVATVTAGPGLTNTVTAIKNAQMAESPLLLMGGAAATLLKGRGALQDIDQMALFRPLCKFCATITKIRDIVPTLRQAIHAAQSGTPGPVFVEFPIDTLYPYELVHRELGVTGAPRNMMQRLVNAYLEWHVSRLFGDAWDTQTLTPLEPDVPLPKPTDMEKAVQMLRAAKKPLILIGSQATLAPVQIDALRKAVEDIGVPCFLGGMARGLLGRKSALHIRQCRRDALRDADLVLLAGTVADFRLSYGRVLSRKATIIAVNRNRTQLYKNSDMFWSPTLAVQSDVASFMVLLRDALLKQTWTPNDEWLQTLTQRDMDKENKNKLMANDKPEQHLNVVDFLMKLEEQLPDDVILVADGGDFVGTAAYTLRPRGPLSWLDPGAFGTLGVGGGFAIGAKLCNPERPVIILYGDGSLGYSMIEYDTYQRHNIPIISVVGNDACWSQIAREQVPLFKTAVACNLQYSAYEQAVQPFGAVGMCLDTDNYEQMTSLFAKALDHAAKGQAVLLNVLLGKSSFREGSISV